MNGWFRCGPGARFAANFLVIIAMNGAAMAVESKADVVAKFGASEITVNMLEDFVRSLDQKSRKQALADPQLMNQLVGVELARIAVLNEAKSKKWEQRPEVARKIERSRDDVVASTYLASVAALPQNFPSDAEIKSAFDVNRDRFMVPRQYRLEQIFVRLPAGGDKKALETAQKKVDDLARRAKVRNVNFEDLARTNSEHQPSAARGGDLGWADQSQIVPEIRNQVAGMDKGEISDPILGSTGWHIVRMVDTKPAAVRPLIEVKETLVAMLRQRKIQEIQQAYVARLLEKSPVTVNEPKLRTLFEAAP